MASSAAKHRDAVEPTLEPRVVSCSPSAQTLMASVLRSGAPLVAEYPLIFGTDAPGKTVLIEAEDGRALSTCAFIARDFVVGERRLRAGLIGSVATDPAHRGRGLASRVLDVAQRELAQDGCLFALLWAEDPAFYQARGYRTIGRELDHFLPAGTSPKLPSTEGVRVARPEDANALHALHLQHSTRIERTVEEMAALLQIPGMEVLLHESGGVPEAYSCRGRGEDLHGVVHEWGGAIGGVLACLAGHLASAKAGSPEELVVLAAADSQALSDALVQAGLPLVPGVLGMAHLLNPDAARALVVELAAGAESFAAELPEESLLQLLFTDEDETGLRCDFEDRAGLALPALPLMPFVWGLDSV